MRADAAGQSQRPDLKLAFESAHLFHHLATGHLGLAAIKFLHLTFDTAYRITVPCVLQVAFLRRKHLSGGITLASAAAKIKKLEEQLIKASKSFEAHNRLSEFVISLWAIGYAVASCDGPVTTMKRHASLIYFRCIKGCRPLGAEGQDQRTGTNPTGFFWRHEVRRLAWQGGLATHRFSCCPSSPRRDEPTEKINEFEEKFLAKWDAYKLLNA